MATQLSNAGLPNESWHEINFTDHADRPAHSLWKYVRGKNTSPPQFSFQIYSIGEIPMSRISAIYDLVAGSEARIFDDKPVPRFDFYEPLPDLPACVEHQRREIMFRKSLPVTQHPLHLIPKVAISELDGWSGSVDAKDRVGFVMIITPDIEDCIDYPIWANFPRPFRSSTPTDTECWDMNFERMSLQKDMNNAILTRYRASKIGAGPVYDYGDEAEILSPGPDNEEDDTHFLKELDAQESQDPTKDILVEKIKSSTPEEGMGYLTHNNSSHATNTPQVRYIFYLAFSVARKTSLERIARHFTASVISHWTNNASFEMAFHYQPRSTAEGSSLFQDCLEHTRAQLRLRPSFDLGTLDEAGIRNIPRDIDITKPLDRDVKPCKTCSIIITSCRYMEGKGMYMVMTDHAPPTEPTPERPILEDELPELNVWSVGSMKSLAMRLSVSQPELVTSWTYDTPEEGFASEDDTDSADEDMKDVSDAHTQGSNSP